MLKKQVPPRLVRMNHTRKDWNSTLQRPLSTIQYSGPAHTRFCDAKQATGSTRLAHLHATGVSEAGTDAG